MKEKALRDTQIRSVHEMGEWRELRNCELTKSLFKNREKVMIRYKRSLHRYKNCKQKEIQSGKTSQDSPHCSFSPRSRTWWLKWSVNLSDSQDESSSCLCTTTLYGEKRRNEELCIANSENRSRTCKKVRARTLVVSWAWIRKEMVRNSHVQTEWRMGSCPWGHDAQLQWKWTLRIPWNQCFGMRSSAKQRKKEIVF